MQRYRYRHPCSGPICKTGDDTIGTGTIVLVNTKSTLNIKQFNCQCLSTRNTNMEALCLRGTREQVREYGVLV
jgi:hypothetical protein